MENLGKSIIQCRTTPTVNDYDCSSERIDVYDCQSLAIFLSNNIWLKITREQLTLIPSHVYSTRFSSNSSLILPALYKTVSHHQFLFTTVKLWNTLPLEIKEIQDRAMF